jgi:hypothetical protein
MHDDRLENGRGDQAEVLDRVSMQTPSGEDVSTTVVLVVEKLTGTPMEDLPLLERKINIDALNELFEPPTGEGSESAAGTLQFEYAGCTITVDSEGKVVAHRQTQGGPDAPRQEGETREM